MLSLWRRRSGPPAPPVKGGLPLSFVTAAECAPRTVARDALFSAAAPVRLQLGHHEEHRFAESLERALCHGDPECLRHESYFSEPPTFVRLLGARVDPRWGLVQTAPGRFLEESVHAIRWLGPKLSMLPGNPANGAGAIGYVVEREGREVCRPEPPKVRVRGRHLLLCHWAAHNYGHFAMDCLPGAFVFREELRAGRLTLLARPLESWQRRLLGRLGVPAHAIREVDEQLVEVEELVFPLALTCCYTARPGPLNRQLFAAMAAPPDAAAPARIYVSRTSRQGSRVMLNEEPLRRALSQRGFREIDPGRHNVDEQARLFSRAEVVVGAMGAGMTNIGFAPPGCRVLQLMPESVAETWTAHFAHVLGHRTAYVTCPVVASQALALAGQTRGDVELSYEAPLSATLAAIDGMLG